MLSITSKINKIRIIYICKYFISHLLKLNRYIVFLLILTTFLMISLCISILIRIYLQKIYHKLLFFVIIIISLVYLNSYL